MTGSGRTSGSQASGTTIQAGTGFPSNRVLVQLGDGTSGSPIASFGSLLSSVTVDCNAKTGCTGVENFSAQEQSGLEHVNVINYANKGIYVHGSFAQNSHYTDVEVNGCTVSSSTCPIQVTPTVTTPVEIDNVPALRPIEGITVNPVGTSNSGVQSISATSGDATITATTAFVGTLAANDYVTISGVLLSSTGSGTTNFNGTYQVRTPSGSTFHVTIGTVSDTCSSPCSGSVALVPTSGVVVCSGITGCADNSGNPTTVTFVGAHFENAGKGIDAKGAQTTLNLVGGSCPITGATTGPNATGNYSDVSYCAFLESGIEGAHIQNLYSGPVSQFTLEDDNVTPSYQTLNKFIQLYDIGAPPTSASSPRTRHCSELDCTDQIGSLIVNGGSGTNFTTLQPGAPSGAITLTLPTTAGTLAQNFVGDGTVLSNTPANASTGGALTASLASAAQTTVLGNPTGSTATPIYTTTPVLGGILKSQNGVAVTASIALNTSFTTIASWSLPAGSQTWSYQCNIVYSTTAGTTQPSLTLAINAAQSPAFEYGQAIIYTSIGTSTNAAVDTLGSANFTNPANNTNETILAGQAPSAAGTYQAQISGAITSSATAGIFGVRGERVGGTGTGISLTVTFASCLMQ